MGSVTSTFASDIATSLTIKSRQRAVNKKARKSIALELKWIESKAKETSLHDPLHPSRPYGLAGEMEGFRRHIWDFVFVHVNDLDTIVNLREVYVMFRQLLERKYVTACLPHIIVLCLERKVIPWDYDTETSNWVKTLSSLRILSSSTRASVGKLFDRGLLKQGDWFFENCPHFFPEPWKIPTFEFRTVDGIPMALQKTLDRLKNQNQGVIAESIPIKALMFIELPDGNHTVVRQQFRCAFQECLEKIGSKITSFLYCTHNESQLDVYNNLRRFVSRMPNLEELMVVFTNPGESPYFKKISPFPSCANLKRYAEGYHGFGFPYINEIVNANPTIEEVLLGETSASNLEVKNLKAVLDTLPLKTFHCASMSTIKFLEHRFNWAPQLRRLTLLDATTTPTSPEIPSKMIFNFMSQFKSLKSLRFISSRIRDTGGHLNLPMLEKVYWSIGPDFKRLEFLKRVENLMWLCLDISAFPPEYRLTSKMMELLGNWYIPELFPGLEKIYVKTERNGFYKIIWESLA